MDDNKNTWGNAFERTFVDLCECIAPWASPNLTEEEINISVIIGVVLGAGLCGLCFWLSR